MKSMTLRVLLTMLLAAASFTASADELVGLKTPNGQLAKKIIDLWFNEGKAAEVFDKYVSRTDFLDHYGDHTTNYEQTRADEVGITPPGGFKFTIKQLVAQGDLVFAHIEAAQKNTPDKVDQMVIIFRFQNNLLTDAWNIHTPIEQDASLFFDEKRPAQPGYMCANGTCQTTRPARPAAGLSQPAR